ncbi:ROK family transcriptional regulator [Sphingobacterium sp. SGG-5]|uniref:ROK family transcriptional regulator n=1 Tax=Sphingobacterium sp. SGG-5 TaxID=2710881 RepID=UPI0013ED763B|nr:ROK family transcriptional regulator [Sphingobacterium sp. SGG-5]NGM60557.1 ROK family transcriptional regulator [Sphingobacterium sp. SGG-5]
MRKLEELLEQIEKSELPKSKKAVLNKVKLLRTIFKKGLAAVGDLSQEMGLSFPTVNALILDLLEKGLVVAREKGESIGGRRPVLYQLNDGIFQVLCIEIERFSVRLVVLDNNNNVIYRAKSYPFEIVADSSRITDLTSVINTYLQEIKVDIAEISAIGVNMPGLVNSNTSTNETFYTGTGSDFNISTYLSDRYNKYVVVINDVKVAALSELIYGAAQHKKNVLVILMDWGIGLGIISNGTVYMGNDGFSGEMGHMVFVEDGELCYCGKRGCLETIASGIYLVNQAKADIQAGVPTLLKGLVDIEDLQPQHIIEVANKGDQYAIDLISALGKNLGKAISMLMQILNPESVVLSGKFAKAGTLITIPIQQSLNTYTMNAIRKNSVVELSPLDGNGYAKGLARYTFEKYFEQNLDLLN